MRSSLRSERSNRLTCSQVSARAWAGGAAGQPRHSGSVGRRWVPAPATVRPLRREHRCSAPSHRSCQNRAQRGRPARAQAHAPRQRTRQGQVCGLTWPLRQRLLAATGGKPIDARNRALGAVAYDGMLRRSDLSALQVDDLIGEMRGDATLLGCRAKTDQERLGRWCTPRRIRPHTMSCNAGKRARQALPKGASHGFRPRSRWQYSCADSTSLLPARVKR